jgi:hypothetical protein
MRSFATALVSCLLAGTAGAQCNSSKSAWVDASFIQELYSPSPQQPAPAGKHAPGAVVTTAALTPARTSTATRTAAAAPQVKVDRPEPDFSRTDEALYAAIAVMAAIALRRYGR